MAITISDHKYSDVSNMSNFARQDVHCLRANLCFVLDHAWYERISSVLDHLYALASINLFVLLLVLLPSKSTIAFAKQKHKCFCQAKAQKDCFTAEYEGSRPLLMAVEL